MYENEIHGPEQPENTAELTRRWPVARFPLLLDGETTVFEASAIIEHLTAFHAGPEALIPVDAKAAACADARSRIRQRRLAAPDRRGSYRTEVLSSPLAFASVILPGVDDAYPYQPFFPLGTSDRDGYQEHNHDWRKP